jgi:RNA polymerase sigma-70 factor (ECF subfamily)
VGQAVLIQPLAYNAIRTTAGVTTESWEARELVVAARRGDRSAFGRLYELFGRMVHGVLLTRVPHDVAEDLVQDVFIQAMRRLEGLRDPAAFGGWLAMIARNRANDFHRQSRETTELKEDSARQAPPSPEAVQVLDIIKALPEAYRETLVLRLAEGMTGPEIAERTGLTPESVRVNLHRGMKLLRERLGGVTEMEGSR